MAIYNGILVRRMETGFFQRCNTHNEACPHYPNHDALVEKAVGEGHDSDDLSLRTSPSRPEEVRNTVACASKF